MVYMAKEAQKAGLDELNDFEEGEGRPVEIHEAWTQLGCPTSFSAFQTARKGKARAISPIPPTLSSNAQPTPLSQPNDFTGALASKFGLPDAAIHAFSSKAVSWAERSSSIAKGKVASFKYKPFKGAAREEASVLIDEALRKLVELSQKHGTDPTATTKLFQKKLDYFSGSLWDMWEIQHALKRVTKSHDEGGESNGEEEVGPSGQIQGDDRTPGSEEAGETSRGTLHLSTKFYLLLFSQTSRYIYRCFGKKRDTGQGGCSAVQQGESCCDSGRS